MMRIALPLVIVTLYAVTALAGEQEGFINLLEGDGLDGWEVEAEKPVADDQWSVRDGVLSAKPGWSWLRTKKEYGDFVLRVEWRVPENGNSGVFVRVPELEPGQHPHEQGVEIQVLDDEGSDYAGKLKPWQYSGSIYGVIPATNAGYRRGEWNSYEITCRGNLIRVTMNGRQVAEADMSCEPSLDTRPRRGFIGLQNHGSPVEYRNILLKPLD